MEVVFREIKTIAEIEQFSSVQEEIFSIRPEDRFPSHFISMLGRNDPEMGFAFGAYKIDNEIEELIGVNISITTNEQNTLYAISTGVLPKYRNGIYGPILMSKAREHAIQRNFNFLYSIFNYLEANLGRLYFRKFGFVGVRLKVDSLYSGKEIMPNDKVLIKWDLLNSRYSIGDNAIERSTTFQETIETLSIANEIHMPDEEKVLVKIPNNYRLLKENEPDQALSVSVNLRKVLLEYLNARNYNITDCITGKMGGIRESYYLLEACR
jgi:predicted GNAT superfamily acetyltransferase